MTIDTALMQMISGLQDIYGNLISSVILYGSTARGTRAEDSDVDVALLERPHPIRTVNMRLTDWAGSFCG